MNVRSLAVVIFCAAAPFAWTSCANSVDTGETTSPDNSSTGGSSGLGLGQGGSAGKQSASGGGSTGTATGGSAGHEMAGTPGQATGGVGMSGSTGGTGSSTATGGATGGAQMTGTGGAAAGGRPGTGGTGPVPATGGTTGTGGTPATGGVSGTGGKATGGSTGTGGKATGGSTGTGGVTPTGGHAGGMGTGGTPATGGVSGTGGTITSSTAGGTIVPLYTDPTDSSWNAIMSAARAHPTVDVVAIVNPSDGPGSSRQSGYTSGIAALQAANIKVIGYIATGYGANSIASMESQMDSWKSFYPTIQGIFFDEQSNSTSDVAHYQTLSQYAKSKGMSYTVGNPGTDVPTQYIGVLDTMLVYETDGLPSMSSLQRWSSYPSTNFGIIPYKVSSMNATFVQQAKQYTHYVYLTNDDLPNPWDSLTSYFGDLLGALE